MATKTKKSKTVKKTPVPLKRHKKLTKKQAKNKAKLDAKKLPKIPTSLELAKKSIIFGWSHRRTLAGITAVYLILNIILVRGINGGVNVNELKSSFDQAVGGSGQLNSAFEVFGSLLGSSGTASGDQASVIQSFLLIYESLVLIWAYRQIFSGNKISIKQAYYSSTGQLIPFVLVLCFMFLQFVPLIITSSVYGAVVTNNLASSAIQKTAVILLALVGTAWTLRMLSSSVFALYISTLPDMHPQKALRSARQLVNYRRLIISRRLIFLPVLIILLMGLVVIPLIIYLPALAGPVFYIMATLSLLFVHLYMYQFYRSLLA